MTIDYKDVDVFQGAHQVLSQVNLQTKEEEMVYLIGHVGSGKTSLLKTIYGEIEAQGTCVKVLETDLLTIKASQLPALRKQIGMVFQDFRLFADRSIYYNLNFVLKATGWNDEAKRNRRIEEVLEMVRLSKKPQTYVYELSGGEKQQVCVARALLNNPRIILADEPTGNLDPESGEMVMATLDEIRRQHHATVLVSTHNFQWLEYFPGTVYRTENGKLILQENIENLLQDN